MPGEKGGGRNNQNATRIRWDPTPERERSGRSWSEGCKESEREKEEEEEEEEGNDLAFRNTLELITRNNEERLDNFDPRADRLPLRGNGKFFSWKANLKAG